MWVWGQFLLIFDSFLNVFERFLRVFNSLGGRGRVFGAFFERFLKVFLAALENHQKRVFGGFCENLHKPGLVGMDHYGLMTSWMTPYDLLDDTI